MKSFLVGLKLFVFACMMYSSNMLSSYALFVVLFTIELLDCHSTRPPPETDNADKLLIHKLLVHNAVLDRQLKELAAVSRRNHNSI